MLSKVSISKPKDVKQVVGPTVLSSAKGTPASWQKLFNMDTLWPSKNRSNSGVLGLNEILLLPTSLKVLQTPQTQRLHMTQNTPLVNTYQCSTEYLSSIFKQSKSKSIEHIGKAKKADFSRISL